MNVKNEFKNCTYSIVPTVLPNPNICNPNIIAVFENKVRGQGNAYTPIDTRMHERKQS